MASPKPIVVTPDMEVRFWERVDRRADSECWNWTGSVGTGGYGRFFNRCDRSAIRAHRLSMAIAGRLVQDGEMVVDHICRNRLCVNPAHLRMVSSAVNVLVGTGMTAANAQKTVCKLGHPLSGDNLVISRGARQCLTCRRMRNKAYKASRRPPRKTPEEIAAINAQVWEKRRAKYGPSGLKAFAPRALKQGYE